MSGDMYSIVHSLMISCVIFNRRARMGSVFLAVLGESTISGSADAGGHTRAPNPHLLAEGKVTTFFPQNIYASSGIAVFFGLGERRRPLSWPFFCLPNCQHWRIPVE